MKITFENKNLTKTIKDEVRRLIENGKSTNGNISVEYIPMDEVENYDIPEELTVNASEIYNVSQCVCGSWDQPLTFVAVTY